VKELSAILMAFLISLQRAQEWNISKKELDSLVEIGVLTKEEVKDSISITFNPVSANASRLPNAGGNPISNKAGM
jgi:hypothetical protein